MTLRLTFVGSGDAFGSGGRLQACILLEDGRERVLLDCGTTSLVGLKRLGIDPGSIGLVFLSHLHGDHFGGLPFLILDGQFSRRELSLGVLGPAGVETRLAETMEALFPGSSKVERKFPFRAMDSEPGLPYQFDDTGGTVTFFNVEHASGAPARAMRIQWRGKVISYSGDTAWTPALAEAADGADLLICEAYSVDKPVPYHLSYAELLQHRDELRCERIVLTHMTTGMIEAQDVEFERAFDGMVVDL